MTNLAAIEARVLRLRQHPPAPVIERTKFEQLLADAGWLIDEIERLRAER